MHHTIKKQYYLLHLQYLGYRYHGWLKQPGLKTVESMLEKTARFVFGHSHFTIVGSSRTDSKVSAEHAACELVLQEQYPVEELIDRFNENLPNDIRVVKIEPVNSSFNVITAPRIKEYCYLFSYGEKPHPFCAPLICSFRGTLNIDIMKQGAKLFEGVHDFKRYCATPKSDTLFTREILKSEIAENTLYRASFFPETSYAYYVHGEGFMRHQVRLMMGQLLCLGRGEIGLDAIETSLAKTDGPPIKTIAPSSGLMLHNIRFT